MPIVTLGIDPGNYGAIAFFEAGRLYGIDSMPIVKRKVGKGTRVEMCVESFAANMRIHSPHQAFLEEVGARPGQGVTGMFSFGRGLGRIEGVLTALGIDIIKVYPQTWTKKMDVWEKGHSCRIAAKLWPEFTDVFLKGNKQKCSGRADAALIGLFGLKHRSP